MPTDRERQNINALWQASRNANIQAKRVIIRQIIKMWQKERKVKNSGRV